MRLTNPIRPLYFLAAILVLTFRTGSAEEATPFSGRINADKINLRSDATTAAAVICTLEKGAAVDVVSELYGWYKVRLPGNAPAYIKRSLITCIKYADSPTVGQQAANICTGAKVLRDRVNIRSRPSEDAAIIGTADKNEVIGIARDEGNWCKIEPTQNCFGWVHGKFVNKEAFPSKPAALEPAQVKTGGGALPSGNIVLTGTVAPYGIVFGRIATHKLITSDGKNFLLKGNRSNLNALNRQKVKVIGEIISPPGKKYPVVEVKIIEAIN